jgi:hypothetical protein
LGTLSEALTVAGRSVSLWGRLMAIFLIAAVILLPLRVVAATVPMLIVCDVAAGPSATAMVWRSDAVVT